MTEPRIEVQPDAAALATAVAGELLVAAGRRAGRRPRAADRPDRRQHRRGGAPRARPALPRLRASTGAGSWSGGATSGSSPATPRTATRATPGRRSSTPSARPRCTRCRPPTTRRDVDGRRDGVLRRRMREHGAGEFEVLMLGVGPDGHIASLFPGHPALDVDAIAVGVTDSPKPPPERVTSRCPCLNRPARSGSSRSRRRGEGLSRGGAGSLLPDGDRAPATRWLLDRPGQRAPDRLDHLVSLDHDAVRPGTL